MRTKNDQDFKKLGDLIIEATEAYENKGLNIKLWNRQWKAIDMYFNGSTYQEVLETFLELNLHPTLKITNRIKTLTQIYKIPN